MLNVKKLFTGLLFTMVSVFAFTASATAVSAATIDVTTRFIEVASPSSSAELTIKVYGTLGFLYDTETIYGPFLPGAVVSRSMNIPAACNATGACKVVTSMTASTWEYRLVGGFWWMTMGLLDISDTVYSVGPDDHVHCATMSSDGPAMECVEG